MNSRRGAGSLTERIVFQKRAQVFDELNNLIGDWEDQFTEPARLTPKLGGEAVFAQRVNNTQPYTLVVRSSTRTRGVGMDWRAKNARTGAVYDLKSVTNPDERNQYLEFLVVQGDEA